MRLGVSVPLTRVQSVVLAVWPRTLKTVSAEPDFLITKLIQGSSAAVVILTHSSV